MLNEMVMKSHLNALFIEMNDFNSLAKAKGQKTRLQFNPDQEKLVGGCPTAGYLVMGTEEQFRYGTYQAMLMYEDDFNFKAIQTIIRSMRMYLCFEFGE